MNGSPRSNDDKTGHHLAPVIGVTGLLALLGVGLAVAAYLRRYVIHDAPMTAALSGELHDIHTSAGRLAYYMSAPAHHSLLSSSRAQPPLVFFHSINAAASSYEIKPLYEHYAKMRSVYSLDLPGFGFSERRNRRYSPRIYRDAMNDFVGKVSSGTPVDAVALSLSSEFLAQAALERPKLYRTLTFITPTGFTVRSMRSRANGALLRLLLVPAWSRILFDLVTSRPSIRYYTRLLFGAAGNRAFERYAYMTSHQPDAQYAPFYFLAGMLFTPAIFTTYSRLTQPVLVAQGRGNFTRSELLANLLDKPNWRVADFERCRDLVHFDDLEGLVTEIDKHLG